jgi:hypothetical protein
VVISQESLTYFPIKLINKRKKEPVARVVCSDLPGVFDVFPRLFVEVGRSEVDKNVGDEKEVKEHLCVCVCRKCRR